MVKVLKFFRQKVIVDGYDQYKTVAFGLIAALINTGFGILVLGFSKPFITRFGFGMALVPFLVSLALLLCSWIAWRGKVKLAFDLVLCFFLIELIIYEVTTIGFGLFFAITMFVFLSTMVVEIAPQTRVNSTLLMTGIFSTLMFLLDFYGPASRYVATGVLQGFIPSILVIEIVFYLVILARQYPRLNLVTKLVIPVVAISYISIGFITAFNYFTNSTILNHVNRIGANNDGDLAGQSLVSLLETQVRSNALFAVLVLIVVTVTAFGVIRLITNPIRELTFVAQKVSTGKLNVHVDITSTDEIGILAQMLNTTTSQLRQLSNNLEQLVAERTHDLALTVEHAAKKSRDLEVILDINQAIIPIQQLDHLLSQAVQLISQRLVYYHVGIFLFDPKKEHAILRASSSEVGQKMVAQGYRLKLDSSSLVGMAADLMEPKVTHDTGNEAAWIDNSDFPLTRSEAAIPLKIGSNVIGILDVQSIQPSAFDPDNMALLSRLADQIAEAIENARLFDDMSKSLAELQTIQPVDVKNGWSRKLQERQHMGFKYIYGNLIPVSDQAQGDSFHLWETVEKKGFQEVNAAFHEISPTAQDESQLSVSLMAQPITLRGEVIGMIQLEEIDPGRIWTDDEISLVKSVADQVGLALENARLLEQTQRRAERESLVAKITGRLRASNNPEEILKTAVLELRQALGVRTAHIVLPDQTIEADPERKPSD